MPSRFHPLRFTAFGSSAPVAALPPPPLGLLAPLPQAGEARPPAGEANSGRVVFALPQGFQHRGEGFDPLRGGRREAQLHVFYAGGIQGMQTLNQLAG